MTDTTISISGMSCQGCADSLSRVFEKEDGILKNSVSFEASAADILYDPSKISELRLAEIVEAAGFSVQ